MPYLFQVFEYIARLFRAVSFDSLQTTLPIIKAKKKKKKTVSHRVFGHAMFPLINPLELKFKDCAFTGVITK